MSLKTLLVVALTTVVLFLSLPFLVNNKKAQADSFASNPAYNSYITAYTSGTISNQSVIRIIFADEVKNIEAGKPLNDSPLEFSPNIPGTAVWADSRTLEFRPEKKLPSDKEYIATVELDKIIPDVPFNLKEFEFTFKTIKQWFEVAVDGVVTTDMKTLRWQKISGSVATADVADLETVRKLVSATQNNKQLKISWEDIAYGSNIFRFSIDSVERGKDASTVLVKWDGKAMDVESKGEKKAEVSSIDDFKVMDIQVVQAPDQYAVVQFSDPVDEKQDLDGLITVSGVSDLKFAAEGNRIKIFFPNRISGAKTVSVETAVKNILGNPLKSKFALELMFEELKPDVKLIGQGVILPNSKGLIFPFQAVNLNAVDVRITKIYEKNVIQFLQINDLKGEYELWRVGKQIFSQKISLIGQATNLGKWNNFTFDLAKLIKTEPGAIYQVTIFFNKNYSLYPCNTDPPKKEATSGEIVESDLSDDGYDYSQRNNPCHSMYYRDKSYTRNILASDIGIMAKRGANGNLLIVATDLLTAGPLSGLDVSVYDYQQQVIASLKTNNDGICNYTPKQGETLLLVLAKKGEQRGYLKLVDGASLSLSMFDVSGETVQKGIKGFIYGERGVWRPGDSLYLNFILEDKQQLLPAGHPVVFELYNPLGQLSKKIVKTGGLNGFYNFSTCTDAMAPTGNWLAQVNVGGVTFEKTLKIETVVPNRLKINLDFGTDKLLSTNAIAGKLRAKWLTGVTARNLKARVDVTLSAAKTSFPKYEGYTFDAPGVDFYSEPQTIFDANVDGEGNAFVKTEIKVSNTAPGMLNANFTVKVFEEGGNFSIDRFSLPYSPFKSYVGIKVPQGTNKWTRALAADSNQTVKLVCVDETGKPASGKLKVQMYKMYWSWWWEQEENDLASYFGTNYRDPYLTKEVSAVNGNAQFVFNIPTADWGRYFIVATDEASGHATGATVYIDYWSSGDNDGLTRKGNEGATMLAFTADKEKYNVGEEVKVTIPATSEGKAFVSIENGTGILKTEWINTTKGGTTYIFKTSEEMTPNVYLYITLLQPHAQTQNDLPIRMYGVIPIRVEDVNTHITPLLKIPDSWRPEEKASITVSEQNGKEMTYTIAVVDEGLLDLTRFKTPDPWPVFYAREALGVKTWDLYDFVIGAYGGELQRILAIGGDGGINNKAGRKANRFVPMVRFMGPFHLKKGDKQKHEFMIPQYVGSVRTMVIAANKGAYGFTEKATPVKKPLMVLGTLPRVVGPSETVDLPVTVFAMEKNIKNVNVQVSTSDLFSMEDAASKTISFSQIGDQVVNFKLKVKPVIGIGKVKILVSSGSEKAAYDIEIESRNPNPKVTNVVEAAIEPGKTWTGQFSPEGMAGTNKAVLELSSVPPINLGERLKYLIEYPHGCIEQTTSGVFPQLFLSDITELSSDKKAATDRNIKAALDRYRSFQTSSGGFSYWPGGDYLSEWGTNYAGHFMIEAELKGFYLPAGMLDSWKRYQKQQANAWSVDSRNRYYDEGLDQAYRLYTLALAKAPELGAMNRLKEYAKLSVAAKWRLAAAYVLCGQTEVAKAITHNIPATVNLYTEMDYTYGSDTRDRAMILETLALLGDKAKATPLAKDLSALLSKDNWLSTQTTAYALLAVSKYLKAVGGATNEINGSYSINKKSPENLHTRIPVKQFEIKDADKAGTAVVTNNGKGVLFARIILEGIPTTDDRSDAESNLRMQVNYTTMNGTSIDPSRLEQGTDFVAQVTFYNPGTRGDYKNLALTQIFPSGWQIHNARMDEQPEAKKNDSASDEEEEYDGGDEEKKRRVQNMRNAIPTYQDIRDDRVYTYFNLEEGETKVFKIVLNASFTGKFYLPTVYCEAMYDHTVNARRAGKWVDVVKSAGDI